MVMLPATAMPAMVMADFSGWREMAQDHVARLRQQMAEADADQVWRCAPAPGCIASAGCSCAARRTANSAERGRRQVTSAAHGDREIQRRKAR